MAYAIHVPQGRCARYTKGSPSFLSGIYTDGFSNQLGRLENTTYTNERLYTALNNISHLGMTEQSHNLYCRLNDWKKSNELTDDILVMGIKIQ